MWIEIEEWRPDINLYKTFFSGHISPDESSQSIKHNITLENITKGKNKKREKDNKSKVVMGPAFVKSHNKDLFINRCRITDKTELIESIKLLYYYIVNMELLTIRIITK